MNINDDFFKNEVFNNIDPRQMDMIKNFVQSIQGKSMNEVMLEFMNFYKKMPKFKEFNQQEKEALISAIYANISPEDRKKLKAILSLMGN